MAVADADFDVGIALSFQPLYCPLREPSMISTLYTLPAARRALRPDSGPVPIRGPRRLV
jgi:hypothetical protein